MFMGLTLKLGRGKSEIKLMRVNMICLQETKCEGFYWRFIIKFCPKRFSCFAYGPSIGASGGITLLSNSSVFTGELIETQVDTYIPKARLFRFE
jgi:hypothetical protein